MVVRLYAYNRNESYYKGVVSLFFVATKRDGGFKKCQRQNYKMLFLRL